VVLSFGIVDIGVELVDTGRMIAGDRCGGMGSQSSSGRNPRPGMSFFRVAVNCCLIACSLVFRFDPACATSSGFWQRMHVGKRCLSSLLVLYIVIDFAVDPVVDLAVDLVVLFMYCSFLCIFF